MSRIRWYHFYFLLALFDVVVILLSLHRHNQTIQSAERLLESAGHLDGVSRWLHLAQQRIVELNAPGNDLFRQAQYDLQLQRFVAAKRNMRNLFESAPDSIRLPEKQINAMLEAEEMIFSEFKALAANNATGEERRGVFQRAGRAMAEMDEHQHEALRHLALQAAENAAQQDSLLYAHERDLQARMANERYFIAAVILILISILFFGRRLQQADQALEAERLRVREERRERLAAIGELCSSVAHGIRNPLASIRSSAELTLEMGRIDDASQRRLKDILDEGRRLSDRVSGLLNLARAGAARLEPVRLWETVRSAVRSLEPDALERSLQLAIDIPAAEVEVLGDRHQIEQMVIELVSNAMDHSQKGQTVSLRCAKAEDNGSAMIQVSDQGPGIAPEIRSRIFDLFFSTKQDGTGIGLATIKRYVQLHGGNVELSPSERGACFTIRIPVVRRAAVDAPPSRDGADDQHKPRTGSLA